MTATAEAQHQWGGDAIDIEEPSLPALKARFLIDRLPERGRVGEIGCGEGKVLRTVARRLPALELWGCDVRDVSAAADGYRFAHIQEGRIPLDDGYLDVVVIFDVLEHVPDPRALLQEAKRVVRPGGTLLMFVPIQGERLSFYEVYRRLLGEDTYVVTEEHIQSFRHDELEALVLEQFAIDEVRYAYHLLGHFMDASFFAAARLRQLRNFWWKDNVYYNREASKASALTRLLNAGLVAGNAVAWAESSLLSKVRFTSAGVLLRATRVS